MAVTFKTDQAYGLTLLPLFGVGKSVIDAVKQHNIEIDQTSPGTFTVKMNNKTYGVIPVKGQAISLAKSGNLGPASKQAIQFQFEQAIKNAIMEAPAATVIPKPVDAGSMPVTPTPKPKAPKASKVATIEPTPATADIKNTPLVKLHEADSIYQPVFGTSHGSVYYVIAILDGMNIAVRRSGGQLSVRAEGTKLKSYASALSDVGFTVKDQYASVHFSISDMALALKTVGAVVGRAGFANVKAVGDLTVVA